MDARVGSESRRRRMASAVHQQAGPFRRSPGDARASVAAAVKKRFMHSSEESGAAGSMAGVVTNGA